MTDLSYVVTVPPVSLFKSGRDSSFFSKEVLKVLHAAFDSLTVYSLNADFLQSGY